MLSGNGVGCRAAGRMAYRGQGAPVLLSGRLRQAAGWAWFWAPWEEILPGMLGAVGE
jgi:hypothetical protein